MAPRLCSVCAIVPHWLSSLPWDDFLYYDETTITLRSWRGMLEQAEAAEAAEASRAAAAGTTGTATGTAEKKRRKSGSERRTGVEEYAVGRSGEELRGKTEGEGKSEEGGGCDLCLMITKAANRRRNYDRPYYMPPPPAMDPRHDERYLDVPLVFGREGEKVIGMDVKGRDDYWEYKIVCLSNRELFAVKVVSVPGSWCKFLFSFFCCLSFGRVHWLSVFPEILGGLWRKTFMLTSTLPTIMTIGRPKVSATYAIWRSKSRE